MKKHTTYENEGFSFLQTQRLIVDSTALYNSLRLELGETFLRRIIRSNSVILCSKTSVVDVTIIFTWKTQRYLSRRPSPICSSILLFRTLLLLETTSEQQYVLQQRYNNSVHLNSSLKSPYSLLSCFGACHSTFGGTSLRTHLQWNYHGNVWTAVAPTSFCFHIGYNPPVPSRQEQDTTKLWPFPTPRTC